MVLLYPVAKTTAYVIDIWPGREGIQYMRELYLMELIRVHTEAEDSEAGALEGQGAINFLKLDDLLLTRQLYTVLMLQHKQSLDV